MPIAGAIVPIITAIASHYASRGNGTTQTDRTTPNLAYPLDPRTPPVTTWRDTGLPVGQGAQNRLGFESPYDTIHGIDQSTYAGDPTNPRNVRLNLPGENNYAYFQSRPVDMSQYDAHNEIAGNYTDLLRQLMENYGKGIHIPGGSIHAATAHARHATATHAEASLIDMLDKAYNERPDADLREDIYGRLSTGARASAANEARSIKDAARLSGAGPNAPWAQSLIAEANRNASKTATQGLTDFYDRYVEAAFARRHGALSTNAELQTGVNTFNAGADNQVSMFNAGADNQVSMFNAGARNAASAANAQLNQAAAGLRADIGRQQLSDILRMSEFALTPRTEGSTTTRTVNQPSNFWSEFIRSLPSLIRDNAGGGGGALGGDVSGGVLDSPGDLDFGG